MKFGLAVNADETVPEIVEKSVEAEKLGIDYVWVPDVPVQFYAPAAASAVAARTKNTRVGLGLLSVFLHSPLQIARSYLTLVETYGERFDLCIGPGDRNLLKSVGVSISHPIGTRNYILDAKRQIEKTLRKNKVKCRIWLGAQGLKMLKLSKFFDGVLLNYAHPNLVKWAVDKVGPVTKKGFQFGVFSSSYVYVDFDPKIYNLLRMSCVNVALGASKTILKNLSIYDETVKARKKLDGGVTITSIIDEMPPKTMESFSILRPSTDLRNYISEISKIGIDHVVFGYPQNFSKQTVKALAQGLKDYTRLKRHRRTRNQ